MSFKRYQQLGEAAVLNFYNGNYRESADKYLEAATTACPGTWADGRWHIFHGYTSILREKYFAPSERDMDALDRMIHDKSEGKLFRAEAAFTRGLLLWDVGERIQAAELYRESIRIAEKASEKERQRLVLSNKTDTNNNQSVAYQPVKEVIDSVVAQSRENLAILERPSFRPLMEPQKRSNGTVCPTDVRHFFTSPDLGCQLTKPNYDKLISVGGAECDHCGTKREDLGLSHLKICSRCMRAFYCSQDCQKRQWKAGHKEACRKPGEVKDGDFVRLQGLASKPELNGRVVQAIQPLESQPGRWEVQIDQQKSISVAAEKLEQLRPLH